MLFKDYIHSHFLELVCEIHAQGHRLGVVGGTVRDFYLGIENKHDYDCEIRSNVSNCTILEIIKALSDKQIFQVEELPYGVYRLQFETYVVELSFPRIETYNESFNHSNFSADFSAELDYEESVFRRDFTINSMIYEYEGEWKLIDPLNGKKDLDNKKLKACSSDFSKDPVRFLRAVRFKNLLGFELDRDIQSRFRDINIKDFNPHFVRLEALKSKRPMIFLYDLLSYLGFKPQVEYTLLSKVDNIMDEDLKKHLSSLMFLETKFLSKSLILLGFSIELKDLIFPVEFRAINGMTFEELTLKKELKRLLNTFSYLKKLDEKYLDLYKSLNLVDIDSIKMEMIKKIKIDLTTTEPKLRSIVDFHEKLKRVKFD